MGLMMCNRNECENILCDRYSPRFGYICDSCFEEFVNGYQKVDIEHFMSTEPGTYCTDSDDFREFAEIVFQRVNQDE